MVADRFYWLRFREKFDWVVALRNPKEIWQAHPSYLVIEILFVVCGFLTLKHALKKGGRNFYLWLTAVLYGLAVESLSYLLPEVDNFWHAQSTVMFFGYRLPLHIVLLYPVLLYSAYVAVDRLKLPFWAEPPAWGVLVVLLDVPFDILGVKFLWWTWHDTDPNIYDRHYWVPWTSYYFHAAFVSSLGFVFRLTGCLIVGNEKRRVLRFMKEMSCSILTALLAIPLGILQFVLVYHSLHDLFRVPTEVCVLLFLTLYLLIVWTAEQSSNSKTGPEKGGQVDEMPLVVFLFYVTLAAMVALVKPEEQRSTGLHEPIGACNVLTDVYTPFGTILKKRKYLCVDNYDEAYYDFHCVRKRSTLLEDNKWYTVCGTPFPNAAEYLVVVWAFCSVGLYVYYQLLYKSKQKRKVKVQ